MGLMAALADTAPTTTSDPTWLGQLVPGVLTLLGVVAGVALSAYLGSRQRKNDRHHESRVEQRDAIVAVIGAARPWLTSWSTLGLLMVGSTDLVDFANKDAVTAHGILESKLGESVSRARLVVWHPDSRKALLDLGVFIKDSGALTGKMVNQASEGTLVAMLAGTSISHTARGEATIDALETAALDAFSRP